MVTVAEAAAALERKRAQAQAAAETKRGRKNFYLSPAWRRLRYATLRENAKAHDGTITCEVCGSTTGPWHVDHIVPRSKSPARQLDPENLQVACADCNLGKGNSDAIDWRKDAQNCA